MKHKYRIWIRMHDQRKLEKLLISNSIRITNEVMYHERGSLSTTYAYDVVMSTEDELMLQLSIDCVALNRKDDGTELRTIALDKVARMHQE